MEGHEHTCLDTFAECNKYCVLADSDYRGNQKYYYRNERIGVVKTRPLSFF